MGGRLTVSSRVNHGSTFTFVLPYKVSLVNDSSDDADELSDMADQDAAIEDETSGFFQFQPRTLGSLFSSNVPSRTSKLLPNNIGFANSNKRNGFYEDSYSYSSNSNRSKKAASVEDMCSMVEAVETSSEPESSFSHSPESETENLVRKTSQNQDETNRQSKNAATDSSSQTNLGIDVGMEPKTSEQQRTCQTQDASAAPTSQSTIGSTPPATASKIAPKILLVEDNEINVKVAKRMMNLFGHAIDVVYNGVEAVRAVQRQNYNLVLMVISRVLKIMFSRNASYSCFDSLSLADIGFRIL